MEKPEVKQKFVEGPVAVINVRRPGAMSMGPALGQWFVFCLVVSLFVAYIASHATAWNALPECVQGRRGHGVPRVCGGRRARRDLDGKPWGVVAKDVFDGLVYGLVTAGTFGWLWPR